MRLIDRPTTLPSRLGLRLAQIDAVPLSDGDEDDLELVAELDLDQVLEVLHHLAPLLLQNNTRVHAYIVLQSWLCP